MVELIENSLHPIIEELEQWQDIIWNDYLEYKYRKEQSKKLY